MAFLTFNFRPYSLKKDVAVNIILPTRYNSDATLKRDPIPVLYLLHGLNQNHTSWMRMSSIERYTRERNLAVVMPDGDRVFYSNTSDGRMFFDYVTKELPEVMEALFNVSSEREHRFVAGLSMGGYGAFKCALTYPERYGACASFSGAVDIYRVHNDEEEKEAVRIALGDTVKPSNDLKKLAEKAAGRIPPVYHVCGKEDFLYGDNIDFRDFLAPICENYHFEDGHGTHDWSYWDMHIEKMLFWLDGIDPTITEGVTLPI